MRLARLEAEHAAQAKEIEKLRLLAKLEADHAAQAREIERLKQQLNESDSSKHAPTVRIKKMGDFSSRPFLIVLAQGWFFWGQEGV